MTGKRATLLLSSVGGVYLILHLLSLGFHPFVHSDEAWLASLTRAMMEEKTPAATEDVFVLTPRYPHALKTAWHLLQAPFLAVSWTAFAARLPSLGAAMAVLVLTWKITGRLGLRSPLRYLSVLLLAVNPQFLYLSHLARQEMLLIALYAWSLDLKLAGKPGAVTALPAAAAIFFHPNAFIIAVGIAAFYIPDTVGAGRRRAGILRRPTAASGFALVLAASAGLAVGLSFAMDPDFLSNYLNFGDSVGTGDSLLVKFLGLPVFISKMVRRQAGTYYLADVRPFYAAAMLGYLAYGAGGLLRLWAKFRNRIRFIPGGGGLLLTIPAMLTATALVGKYGPPTIGFLMLPGTLLFVTGLAGILHGGNPQIGGRPHRVGRFLSVSDETGEGTAGTLTKRLLNHQPPVRRMPNRQSIVMLVLILPLFGWSVLQSAREVTISSRQTPYRDYLSFAASGADSDGRVLGNLNTAFAFGYDALRIWRDLEALPEGESLEEFIDGENIRWILLSDELEFIYSSRPVWNGIYGNPRWYPELMDIIERRGVPVSGESMPVYAMRIIPFIGRKDWSLVLYRID